MATEDTSDLREEKIRVLKAALLDGILEDSEAQQPPPDLLWEALADATTLETYEESTLLQEREKETTNVWIRRTGCEEYIIELLDKEEIMQRFPITKISSSRLAATLAKDYYWKQLCTFVSFFPVKSTQQIIVKCDGDKLMAQVIVIERQKLLQLLTNAKYMNVLVKHLVQPAVRWQPQQQPPPLRHGDVERFLVEDNSQVIMPAWAQSELKHRVLMVEYDSSNSRPTETDEHRIQVAIELSKKNVQHDQEPFACVIYQHNPSTTALPTKPFVIGVNCNEMHAETTALRLFFEKLTIEKSTDEILDYWMYSSCEPCCDCFGSLVLLLATLQADDTKQPLITKLFCAATKADAESLGFDEGPINDASFEALHKTFGITVIREFKREKSAAVIREYGRKMRILADKYFYSFHLSDSSSNDIVNSFHSDGFVVLREAINIAKLQELWQPYAQACFQRLFGILHDNGHIDEPTDRIGDDYTMGLGLKNGFAEVVLRSPGRYEISLLHLLPGNERQQDLNAAATLPPLPYPPEDLLRPFKSLLPQFLGNCNGYDDEHAESNMKLIHLSLLIATPGSTDQAWHADGPHAKSAGVLSSSHSEAAQKAIAASYILEELADFTPVVVSTILVGLDTPQSDIDIVCCYESQFQLDFVDILSQIVKPFSVPEVCEQHVVGRFYFAGFEFEIYGSPIPVEQQNGYRHYRVMERLVTLGQAPFQSAIKSLKERGLKTEPAIATLLELEGDPYQAVLTLEDFSDGELTSLLANALTSSSSKYILPCHVYNIFIPLQDTPQELGPTELRPASHYLTKGNLAKNMLLAKCKKTLRTPEWPSLNVGDALIFDYLILHRGRANTTTDRNRNYLVMTYAEPWFQDKLNFPKRSMYEMRVGEDNGNTS